MVKVRKTRNHKFKPYSVLKRICDRNRRKQQHQKLLLMKKTLNKTHKPNERLAQLTMISQRESNEKFAT